MKQQTVKRLFVVIGSVSLAAGIIGIILPVLPTTPFLLLAAACYARGSDRLHQWLLTNRLCRGYITNYLEGKGMPLKTKLFTILLLWAGIGLTIAFGIQHWGIRAVLLLIAAGVTTHISLIKKKTS